MVRELSFFLHRLQIGTRSRRLSLIFEEFHEFVSSWFSFSFLCAMYSSNRSSISIFIYCHHSWTAWSHSYFALTKQVKWIFESFTKVMFTWERVTPLWWLEEIRFIGSLLHQMCCELERSPDTLFWCFVLILLSSLLSKCVPFHQTCLLMFSCLCRYLH